MSDELIYRIGTEYNPLCWIIERADKSSPIIGKDFWLGPFCLLDGSGGLIIGDNVTVAAGSQIYSHGPIVPFRDGKREVQRYQTKIGSNVYIGPNVIIEGGVNIGDGAVIGAGSYVRDDVPPNTLACGCPAKVVKEYEREVQSGM